MQEGTEPSTTAPAPGSTATYLIELRPLPGVDGIAALKRGLKLLLRRCGLRAISVEESRR